MSRTRYFAFKRATFMHQIMSLYFKQPLTAKTLIYTLQN
jgi:hypothetical protein